MSRLLIDHHDPGHLAVAIVENVTLYTWRSTVTSRDADDFHERTQRIYDRYPQGVSIVHWVGSGPKLPDSKVRERLMRTMRHFASMPGVNSVILTADGFWASAVRAMISGLAMGTIALTDLQITGSVDEAMDWFPEAHRKITGVTLARANLEYALRHIIALE